MGAGLKLESWGRGEALAKFVWRIRGFQREGRSRGWKEKRIDSPNLVNFIFDDSEKGKESSGLWNGEDIFVGLRGEI